MGDVIQRQKLSRGNFDRAPSPTLSDMGDVIQKQKSRAKGELSQAYVLLKRNSYRTNIILDSLVSKLYFFIEYSGKYNFLYTVLLLRVWIHSK